MMNKHYSIFILIAISCMIINHSCKSCDRQPTIENIVIDIDLSELGADSLYLVMGQQVLYALPTPIEASMLVKNWGVPNPSLLNDPTNAPNYLTKKKQALNFGVYITDMTTAGLYEQTQTVLLYKEALMRIADDLGLKAAVDADVLQKIEDNINNKNELLSIISELYASCTTFLNEDDRDFYTLAVLTGGWVEGMYIATSMIDENKSENEAKMKQLIIENKLTFDLLWQALSELDIIPEEAVYLMLDMSYLAHLFGHKTLLQIPQSYGADDIANVTPAYFADVKNHVQQLRHQFTKK